MGITGAEQPWLGGLDGGMLVRVEGVSAPKARTINAYLSADVVAATNAAEFFVLLNQTFALD